MHKSAVLKALFPNIRASILTATLLQPDKSWYLTELAAIIGTSPSSLQREVESLSKAGILKQWRDGRRLYVRADTRSPTFAELKSLIEKTAGVVYTLQQELEPLRDGIALAFVYGSIARSEEVSESDIDLLLVGSIGLSDIVPALRRIERTLGRPINPSVYSVAEFRRKVFEHDHFLSSILSGEKQFVKGTANDLEAILGEGRGQASSHQQAGAR